jgi:hypothetical protein
MLNIFDGLSEKPLTQSLEFLHRIGGEKLQARRAASFVECRRRW